MKTNEEYVEEFRQKWEGANTHNNSICTPVMNEMVEDIRTTLEEKDKEADEREHTTISYFCKDELYTDFYECDSCSYSNITLSDSYCGGCGRKVDPTKTDKQGEV